MKKAIIFDMGGVVLNAKIEEAYEILAKKLKISKAQFDSVKNKYIKDAQCGKISTDDLLNKISSGLKIDKDKLRKFWEESYSKVMIINRDVMNLVDVLKKNEYITALITNTIEIHSLLNRKRGIYTKFSPVLLSNEVGMIKPEEGIYKKMLQILNLRADECIFIDDREEHLKTPENMGFKVIHFKDNKKLIKDLKNLGVRV